MKYIITISIIIGVLSCKSAFDINNHIGWTIKKPSDWVNTSIDTLEKDYRRREKVARKPFKSKYDIIDIKFINGFNNKANNSIFAAYKISDINYPSEWDRVLVESVDFINASFFNIEIEINTSTALKTINGKEFNVYHVEMLNLEGKVMVSEDYFLSYIKGLIFLVKVTYTNEKDKNIMMDAFRNSTFKKD